MSYPQISDLTCLWSFMWFIPVIVNDFLYIFLSIFFFNEMSVVIIIISLLVYIYFFIFFLSPLSLLSLLNHVCNNFTLKESICLSFFYCARNQKDSKWNRSLIVCAKRNYKRRGRHRGTNSQWLGKREKIILHSQGWSYLIFGLTKWIHSLPLNYIKFNLI
jgi:hypothetical protein